MTPPFATAEPELLAHEGLHPPEAPLVTHPHRRANRRLWWALAGGAVAVSTVSLLAGAGELVNSAGWPLVGRFFGGALRPELNPAFLRVTASAAFTTLSYALLGTFLSVVLGLVLGIVGSETWWRSHPRRVRGWLLVRGMLSLPRGVHEVVWGLLLVTVLGLDPLVGILAIGIPYGAVTAKVYSELLDEAPHEAFESVRLLGASRLKSLLYTLLPQALPDMVSYAFYRFECSIRAAAILGIIGAGGLGFQLALSFQSLRYGEMWTVIYALVLLCGMADVWSSRLRRRARDHSRGIPVQLLRAGTPPRREPVVVASLLAIPVLVLLAGIHLAPDLSRLWSGRTRSLVTEMGAAAWPPKLTPADLTNLLRLSLETLEMAVLATAVASLGAVCVAFVASRRASRPGAVAIRGLSRSLLLLCRAIPPPVGALLFLFVLFPGPVPGVLALALYNFGILGRLMSEVVDNLDSRAARGLVATGASAGQAWLYAVLPASLPRFAAYSLYRWEVTVRETVVVGLVGAGGLGRLLNSQLVAFDYGGLLATLMALVALTFAGDIVGGAARRALR